MILSFSKCGFSGEDAPKGLKDQHLPETVSVTAYDF